ncbi:hypothetical protein IAT38_007405 [Cryptococcus sp. DSM 104549]
MSLRDTSCYTLTLSPSPRDPAVMELVETVAVGRDEARYARVKERREGEVYSAAIYDVLTGARLASSGYGAEKAKTRRLQLHGPDEDVAFDFTGRINFEWTFIFEGNKYRWTRELYGKDYICSLDRKPDPRVEICLAREAGKDARARLQILHYNIERFPTEIKDLRGLETLLVTSLLCLLDAWEDRGATVQRTKSGPTPPAKESPPIPPPVPARVISEEDFEPENPNEIIVGMNTNLDDHIARAVNLLEDPNILFIVIRTRTAAASQRALEVSLGVTRFRHREGMSDLKQYVVEEEDLPKPVLSPSSSGSRPGPRVIKLDDEPPKPPSPSLTPSKPKWSPPPNLAIYLSTIELPDLKPGRRETLKAGVNGRAGPGKGPGKSPSPGVPPVPGAYPSGPAGPSGLLAPGAGQGGKENGGGGGSKGSRTSSFGKLFKAPPRS